MPISSLNFRLHHDSTAYLIQDRRIGFAAQEERFSRKKFDASFPSRTNPYCLEADS
jgi:carbamoyltransferase